MNASRLQEARLADARTLWPGVWEHNARAKAFCHKHHFVDVGAHVYMVGIDAQTDHIPARPMEGCSDAVLCHHVAHEVGAR